MSSSPVARKSASFCLLITVIAASRLEIGRRERVPVLEGDERAVATEDRRPAELEVDVGGAGLDRAEKEFIQVHAATRRSSAGSGFVFRRMPAQGPRRAGRAIRRRGGLRLRARESRRDA